MEKKVKAEMSAFFLAVCLAAVFCAQVQAYTVYQDGFGEYPGSPADWQTYFNDTGHVQWVVEASDANLVMSFGTDNIEDSNTPFSQVAIAAGLVEVPSPKKLSGDMYVTYTFDVAAKVGHYSSTEFIVSPVQFTDVNYPKPYFRISLYDWGDGAVAYNLYKRDAYGTGTQLFGNDLTIGSIDPNAVYHPGEFAMALNDTGWKLYWNGDLMGSGTHGLNLGNEGWGDTAYVSLCLNHYTDRDNDGGSWGSPTYSWIDFVDVSLPDPSNCNDVFEMGYGYARDLNHDCHIDWNDMAIIVRDWLVSYDPSE